MPSVPVISLVMDLPDEAPAARATFEAMDHAIAAVGAGELRLVRTAEIDTAFVADPGHGVIIGPGSPYEFPDRADDVITSARERGIPLVGT